MDIQAHQSETRIPSLENSPRKRRSFLPAPVKSLHKTEIKKTEAPPEKGEESEFSKEQRQKQIEILGKIYRGQQVLIGGVKHGTVKYFGTTHLAEGLFCGIELEEEEGKHDGLVDGKRYFTCKKGHGIFAPIDKVTLLETGLEEERPHFSPHSPKRHGKIFGFESEERIVNNSRLGDQGQTFNEAECNATRVLSRPHSDHLSDQLNTSLLQKLPARPKSSQSISRIGLQSGSRWDPDTLETESDDDLGKERGYLSDTSRENSPYRTWSSVRSSPASSPKTSPRHSVHFETPDSENLSLDRQLFKKFLTEKSNLRRGERRLSDHNIAGSPKLNQTYVVRKGILKDSHLSEGYGGSEPCSPARRLSAECSTENIPEFLSSDGRQYLNFAFDNGSSSSSSPLHGPRIEATNFDSPEKNKQGVPTTIRSNEELTLVEGSSPRHRIASADFSPKRSRTSTPNRLAGKGSGNSSTEDLINAEDFLDWRQEASDDEERLFAIIHEKNEHNKNILIQECHGQQYTANKPLNSTQPEITNNSKIPDHFLGPKKPMTDSGVADLGDIMAESQEMRMSQNLETVVEVAPGDDVMTSVDRALGSGNDNNLLRDLQEGHNKKCRPESYLSTTSADTGYVPDTDSEMETVTGESPLGWNPKGEDGGKEKPPAPHMEQAYQTTFQHYQQAVMKGTHLATNFDSDSDIFSDTGTILADSSTLDQEKIHAESLHIAQELEAMLMTQKLTSQMDSEIPIQEHPQQVSAGEKANATVDEDERIEADQQSDLEEVNCQKVNNAEQVQETEGGGSNDIENVEKDDLNLLTREKASVNVVEDVECFENPGETTEMENKSASRESIIDGDKPDKTIKQSNNRISSAKKTSRKPSVNVTVVSKVAESIKESEHKNDKKVEKEPVKVIKRTPPKSKWGNIMDQINDNQKKPKPKTEVKSKLGSYLSAPTPVKKEEKKEKPKRKIPSAPKVDYSKVQSKLSIPPPQQKRSVSPTLQEEKKSSKGKEEGKTSSESQQSTPVPQLNLNDSLASTDLDTPLLSARSSSSVGLNDSKSSKDFKNGPTSSHKPTNPSIGAIRNVNRRISTSSVNSDVSQVSSKLTNKSSSLPQSEIQARRKSMPAKTSASSNEQRLTKSSLPKSAGKPLRKPGPVLPRMTKQQEINRLEGLCEARTKELKLMKMKMKHNLKAFDAMAALVKYLSHDLDAFVCPQLKDTVLDLKNRLASADQELDTLRETKLALKQELESLIKQNEKTICELQESHSSEITQQKETMTKDTETSLKKLENFYLEEMSRLKKYQEKQIHELETDNTHKIKKVEQHHQDDIQVLRNKQEQQMEELHKQHRDKIEDITRSFETMKESLSDRVEALRVECQDLRHRAVLSEEALQRDSDYKVQIALAPYRQLPQEVESLKMVLEMKDKEIQKLRTQNNELEKQLEELPKALGRIQQLQQKLENTEAICSIKSDHEKQLHDKVQLLMRKFDKETKANKRLSMDYEELVWKLNQSGADISSSTESLFKHGAHSPSPSEKGSPNVRRKSTKSPARDAYRRSVSSSATFSKDDTPKHSRMMTRSQNDAESIYSDCQLSECGIENGLTVPSADPSHMSQSLPVVFHMSPQQTPRGSQRSHTPSPPPPNGEVFSGNTPRSGLNNKHIPFHKGEHSRKRTISNGSQREDIGVVNEDMFESQEDVSEKSNVGSNASSLQWDYEKMGSSEGKSMDSSQNSDCLLEQTCTPDFWTQDCTSMDSSKEFSKSSSTDTVIIEDHSHCDSVLDEN